MEIQYSTLRQLSVASLFFIGFTLSAQQGSIMIEPSYEIVYYPLLNKNGLIHDNSLRFGGSLTFNVSDRFGILGGLFYEKRNFVIDYPTEIGWNLDKSYFELSYIGVPVGFVFAALRKNQHLLSINTGLEFSFLHNESIRGVTNDGDLFVGDDDYWPDELLYNYFLGLRYRFFLLEKAFIGVGSEGRFNLNENQGIQGAPGEGSGFSLIFQISLGYKFASSSSESLD